MVEGALEFLRVCYEFGESIIPGFTSAILTVFLVALVTSYILFQKDVGGGSDD